MRTRIRIPPDLQKSEKSDLYQDQHLFIVDYRFLMVLKMFWKCRKCAKKIDRLKWRDGFRFALKWCGSATQEEPTSSNLYWTKSTGNGTVLWGTNLLDFLGPELELEEESGPLFDRQQQRRQDVHQVILTRKQAYYLGLIKKERKKEKGASSLRTDIISLPAQYHTRTLIKIQLVQQKGVADP